MADATPPNIGTVARQVQAAMIVKEPVQPLGYATARDAEGRPLYTVVVVMGRENCEQFEQACQKLMRHMKPVDTFDESGNLRR